MTMIHCPHCGIANRAGSNFCNYCGTDLRAGEADETDRPVPEASSDPSTPAASTSLGALPSDATPLLPPDLEQTESAAAPLADEELLEVEAFTVEPADQGDDGAEEAPPVAMAGRLILGIQGLLEPVRISSELDEANASPIQPRRLMPAIPIELDQLRRLRGLLTQDPTLLNSPPLAQGRSWPALRIPWLFVLLGFLVGLPLFLAFRRPVGEVHRWPGVAEAYAAIQNLAPNAPILILWGYDPATADEMDLLALPLMAHLFDRQSQLMIVSLLPNGPATAQQLFARAKADLFENPATRAYAAQVYYVDGGFLPGGATVLPLLAQDLRTGLRGQTEGAASDFAAALAQPPALAVIVAATAEDVQQWLELVHPLAHTPVVAFTSAGADPPLRPYLESGQLQGLVSGFDGADAYQQLRERPLSTAETEVYRLQRTFQNWGHLAFLLVIVLGNLAALLWARS